MSIIKQALRHISNHCGLTLPTLLKCRLCGTLARTGTQCQVCGCPLDTQPDPDIADQQVQVLRDAIDDLDRTTWPAEHAAGVAAAIRHLRGRADALEGHDQARKLNVHG